MTNTTAHQAAARIREALEQLLNPPHSENVLEAAFQRRDAGRLFNEACSPDSLLALLAERDELAKDAARLDWLERQSKSYGFEGIHEGNAWEIYGAYRSIREAIDSEIAALTNKD